MMKQFTSALKRWKKELILSTTLYVVGIVAGIIIFYLAFSSPNSFRDFVNNLYPDLQSQKGNLTYWNTFGTIYQRNVTAAGITVLLGLLYRYLPLIIVFYNGLIVGLVAVGMLVLGLPVLLLLGSILPHGIFEIPAMLIAGALGIHLSYMAKGEGVKGRLRALTQSQNAILLILVLLFIAALIESGLITLLGG